MTHTERNLKISIKLKREDEINSAAYNALWLHSEFIKIKNKDSTDKIEQMLIENKRNCLKIRLAKIIEDYPETLSMWKFLRSYQC